MGAGLTPWAVAGLLLACSPAPAPGPVPPPQGDTDGAGEPGADPVAAAAAVAAPDTLPVPAGEARAGEHASEHGSRHYRLYVPPGDPAGRPLVVLLHGCTQTAEDFAVGTRASRWADSLGLLVLYPEQPTTANPNACWNWYEPAHQSRGAGEPAILAGMVRSVLAETGADPDRVFVGGISAGGVMAQTLAATYPDLFRALAVHSAPAYGSARDVSGALAVLQQGAPDSMDLAGRVLDAMGPAARPVPTLVIHGEEDAAVRVLNAGQVVGQWGGVAGFDFDFDFDFEDTGGATRAADSTASGEGGAQGEAALAVDSTASPPGSGPGSGAACPVVAGLDVKATRVEGERAALLCTYSGAPVAVEYLRVEGLGHAWSGGAPAGSFTAAGPDATARVLEFFLAAEPGPTEHRPAEPGPVQPGRMEPGPVEPDPVEPRP